MKNSRLTRIINRTFHYFEISAGCLIMALGMNLFLIPNRIAGGGLSGIAIVLYHQFHFPVGISVLLMNIPLFIISWKLLGMAFGIKTLFATVALSLAIDATAFLQAITGDLFLSVLFGGGCVGVGLGLIFRRDATTGGTDLLAKIIHKLIPYLSAGQILLLIDALVVLAAAAVFQQYELALYASVSIMITARIMDYMVVGINYTKTAYIISRESEKISVRLLKDLNRGVTQLEGQGMYTGIRRSVLLCVLRNRDVPQLKRIVQEEDAQAFIFISDAREVLGEGFSYDP